MPGLQTIRATVRAMAALLLAASPAALAHTQNGSLGADPGATDYYPVTCSDDGSGVPASMIAQVANVTAAGAPAASVLVHKDIVATTSTDPVNGDGAASPLVFVNGGVGVYNVFLNKSGAGALNYTLSYHCMTGPNGTGEHTGTTLVFKQNQ
jgi:hypothetical protein